MNKGSSTKTEIPEWAKPYAQQTLGYNQLLQNKLFQGLNKYEFPPASKPAGGGGGGPINPGGPPSDPIEGRPPSSPRPRISPGGPPGDPIPGGGGGGGGGGEPDPYPGVPREPRQIDPNTSVIGGLTGTADSGGWLPSMSGGSRVRGIRGMNAAPPIEDDGGGGGGGGGGTPHPGGIPPGVQPNLRYAGDDQLDYLLGYNPVDVPGLSETQRRVGGLIPSMNERPNPEGVANEWAFQNLGESGAMPTVDRNDPYLRAAKDLFDSTISEDVKNATVGTTGRSTATGRALADQWSKMLLPVMEQRAGQQERAIDRRQKAREFGSGTFLETGGRETSRLKDTLGMGMDYGSLERQIAQEQAASKGDERDRLANTYWQTLTGPLSGFIPSSFGSKTSKS